MAEANQNHPLQRRGNDPDQSLRETLASMDSANDADDTEPDTSSASPDGVSAFVARVLDQLVLSAWLPAAFLTASVALLLQFRNARSANILRTVQQLTAQPVQVLVVMIPLLVIATMVTQAFSYEVIRTLEGYWAGRGPMNLARTLMIRWHFHRKQSTIERLRAESAKALRGAVPEMVMNDIPVPIIQTIEAQISGNEPPILTAEQKEMLRSTDWQRWCDAWRIARIDRLVREVRRYPANYRIMPTKLGNLMRATEDKLQHADGDVQSFVHRRRDTVSSRIRIQHDQFHTRLEMYCTLVLVSALLFALTPIILAGHLGVFPIMVALTCFAAMGTLSYLAAMASASGYCGILIQMDKAS